MDWAPVVKACRRPELTRDIETKLLERILCSWLANVHAQLFSSEAACCVQRNVCFGVCIGIFSIIFIFGSPKLLPNIALGLNTRPGTRWG